MVAVCDKVFEVEVEHRLGIGLVAGRRLVARQDQKVPDPERGRAHEVALQANAVAVPAGQLQDRIDPGLQQKRCRRQRPHVGARAGSIGDVDRIRQALKGRRLADQIARVAGHGRHDLRSHDKALGLQALREMRRRARYAHVLIIFLLRMIDHGG